MRASPGTRTNRRAHACCRAMRAMNDACLLADSERTACHRHSVTSAQPQPTSDGCGSDLKLILYALNRIRQLGSTVGRCLIGLTYKWWMKRYGHWREEAIRACLWLSGRWCQKVVIQLHLFIALALALPMLIETLGCGRSLVATGCH